MQPLGREISTYMLIALLIVWAVYYESQGIKRQRRWLAIELHRQNLRPNLCLICGYNLRGTTAQACPECGTALAQGDNPDEPLPQSSVDD